MPNGFCPTDWPIRRSKSLPTLSLRITWRCQVIRFVISNWKNCYLAERQVALHRTDCDQWKRFKLSGQAQQRFKFFSLQIPMDKWEPQDTFGIQRQLWAIQINTIDSIAKRPTEATDQRQSKRSTKATDSQTNNTASCGPHRQCCLTCLAICFRRFQLPGSRSILWTSEPGRGSLLQISANLLISKSKSFNYFLEIKTL